MLKDEANAVVIKFGLEAMGTVKAVTLCGKHPRARVEIWKAHKRA